MFSWLCWILVVQKSIPRNMFMYVDVGSQHYPTDVAYQWICIHVRA